MRADRLTSCSEYQGLLAKRSRLFRLDAIGHDWQEVPFSFTSKVRDEQATVEIAANGKGTLLLDFVSLMRADARRDGMLRPDLLQALRTCSPRLFDGRVGHTLRPTSGKSASALMLHGDITPTCSGEDTRVMAASAPMNFWDCAAS